MIRNCLGGNSPSTIWRSVRHTPQARTRNSTCPDRTRGSATSTIWRGRSRIGPGEARMAAFIETNFQPHDARVFRIVAFLGYAYQLGVTQWPMPTYRNAPRLRCEQQ